MKRDEVLDVVKKIITVDRASTHGDAENSFVYISTIWEVYLQAKGIESVSLEAEDVAAMMVMFKAVRFAKNPEHLDNALDMVGYAALAGEIVSE